jgi:hypothetical protein
MSTLDANRVRTMLGWVEEYRRATTDDGGPLLEDLCGAHDVETSRRNVTALEGLAEYMRRAGSRAAGHAGRTLKGDSIQTVVGTARTVREVTGGRMVVLRDMDTTGTRLYKSMRRDDGPAGARQSQRALRAQHFRRALNTFDVLAAENERRWGAALTAHNALLRGGEVGRVDRRDFSPDHGLTFYQIEWRSGCADSDGLPWLILWVLAIKDQNHRNAREPILIRQRRAQGGAAAPDLLCTYYAIFRIWMRCIGTLPPVNGRIAREHVHAREPLFAHPDGSAFCTSDVREIMQDVAKAAGEPAAEFGATSGRSGGATDLRDAVGAEAIPLIKQRGRWGSDIAEIYQRALARQQLRGSASMGDATGADIESLIKGWRQRAR